MTKPHRDFALVWAGDGWTARLWEIKGNSRFVLLYLERIVKFGNEIPGPSAIAATLGIAKQTVSRAYVELSRHTFVIRQGKRYYLHPDYCWKGTQASCEIALAQLTTHRLPKSKTVIPEKKKAVNEWNRMLKEQQSGYLPRQYVDRGHNGN